MPPAVPELRPAVDAEDQVKAIKMDRVAISFTPRYVDYEAETNKVFVSGELKSQSYSGVPETFILAYSRKDLFRPTRLNQALIACQSDRPWHWVPASMPE